MGHMRAPALQGDAPGAAARVVTLPRASLVGGKDRKELRFHDFGGEQRERERERER